MRDGRHHARRIVQRLWPRFGGALLTVCAAAILELVSGTVLRVPNPAAILVLTTVFSTFSGALRAGLVTNLVHLREVADGPSTYLGGIIIDITDRKVAALAGRVELHEAGRP